MDTDKALEMVLEEMKGMPEPGGPGWEEYADKMRRELEFMEQHRGVVEAAKRAVESRGGDFWAEFEEWKKNNNASTAYVMKNKYAILTQADIKVLDGSINRRVRVQKFEDRQVKKLYRIWKSL